MAVWSEVSISELEGHFRLEAEFYQPRFLKDKSDILECGLPVKRLGDLCEKVTDGSHQTPDYQEEGVPFIMVRDVDEGTVNFNASKFITPEFDSSLRHCKPVSGDILLTKVGSIGKAVVVPQNAPSFNIFVSLAVLKNVLGVNSYYLTTFLNSHYGKSQSFRQAKGVSQLDLHLQEIREFLIPIPSTSFQEEIADLCRQSQQKRGDSQLLYAQAEATLLEALGLDAPAVSDKIGYERNFSQVMRAQRFDAQYFHPRNWELEKRLLAAPHKRLRQVATIYSGFAWKSEYFRESSEDGEPFVRIRDCKPGQIDTEGLSRLEADYALACRLNGQPISQAQRGDIIIGMDGVDYFYGGLVQSACYVNQRACRVAPFDSALPAEYLMVVINSTLGQSQLLRRMTIAQTVGHITNEDVRDLIIPTSDDLVEEVARKVRDSFQAKTDAQTLLEEAKTRVEALIAEGA